MTVALWGLLHIAHNFLRVLAVLYVTLLDHFRLGFDASRFGLGAGSCGGLSLSSFSMPQRTMELRVHARGLKKKNKKNDGAIHNSPILGPSTPSPQELPK